MLLPITDYCKNLMDKDPAITASEMLHNLHEVGYDREDSVLQVKALFPDLTADEFCRIIVNEYISPLIEKAELRRLLLLCGYAAAEVDSAIERYYPSSLGYVLMLDDSYSMRSASAVIKIDAKAFLDCSRTGDQFGINIFSDAASWLYPDDSDPQPATVTEGRSELEAAKKRIEELITKGTLTDIGAAISLGNDMLEKLHTDQRAYVLISDGVHNWGTHPSEILKNEPPIYIAGLGPYMEESYFEKMLKKNEKSKFYNSPNAFTMMQIFNQILADSSASLLQLNHMESYLGSNYSIHEFTISGQGNSTLVNVVWSDKKYRYTPDFPKEDRINLVLIDPDGQQTCIQPKIAEAGFCIYDLRNVKPGQWKILSQYTVSEPVSATVGVIEAGSSAEVEITGAQFAKIGESIPYRLCVSRSSGLKDLTVEAVCSCPAIDYRTRMQMTDGQNIETEAERSPGVDFAVPLIHTLETLTKQENSSFSGRIEAVQNPGIYNLYFTIRGQYPNGTPFVCQKMHSVVVK